MFFDNKNPVHVRNHVDQLSLIYWLNGWHVDKLKRTIQFLFDIRNMILLENCFVGAESRADADTSSARPAER